MEKTTKKVRPKSVAARPKKEATAARKSTFAIIFVLQKGKTREDGTAPIVARITVNHEMVHFATRMYIHPDRWLPKDYRTAGKSRRPLAAEGLPHRGQEPRGETDQRCAR